MLGPATQLTGRIQGQGGLRIEGKLEGDVSVSGPAEIADGARVEGDVEAESLDVAGTLFGNVTTSGRISIGRNASVRGELRGSQVSIEPGAQVELRLDTELELDLGSRRRG